MTRHFPRLSLASIAGILVLSLCLPGGLGETSDLQITIPPSYKADKPDSYVCTSVELGPAVQLLGVEPHGNEQDVHHILVYGCQNPLGPPGTAWNCLQHAICKDGSSILYGWGRNAPPLEYPPGVGMAIGTGSGVRNIVVQVHYLNPRPPGDRSGVTLKTSTAPSDKAGGILSFATWFSIPPRKASHLIENKFCYQGHQPLTTFAARIHTHALGRSVSLHRQAWDHKGWQLVFANDPQLPQAFYPMTQQQIFPGDRLKVTCDFNSTSRNTPTLAGSTHKNEMCNLYAMVYGLHPYVANIDNGMVLASPSGAMPAKGSFQPDPSPFWEPPQPEDPAPSVTARSTIQQAPGDADLQRQAAIKTPGEDSERASVLAGDAAVAGAADRGLSNGELGREGAGVAGPTFPTPSGHPHNEAVKEGQARFLTARFGKGSKVGDITGVTVAGNGSIWALYRGERHWTAGSFRPDNTMSNSTRIPQNVVMQLHADTGKILAAWGAGQFSMPHMITVDKEGAVYIADVGRHQVLKFSASGVLLLALGHEMKPGNSKDHLCKPTQGKLKYHAWHQVQQLWSTVCYWTSARIPCSWLLGRLARCMPSMQAASCSSRRMTCP
ncbi:PHM/PNGase F domain-containing protein [Dunaliella salina]|uniref:PHM/PNGase F domain-containing protein n=1 Tax=Dunaliella salina TaxID=3046 RepID=A0ABQ7GUK2_DUNSA|nr:PHM/PNGase F domain-containing protein [Dunaliella salina]|eukprot:KAF5838300.1 PHM/PNGase F domain-containing protein [Dunaliella salina]